MRHLHHNSNFLSLLVIKNKSGYFSITYNCLTKSILNSVRLLLAYNLINGYTVQKQNHFNSNITVFLKYEEGLTPVLRNIQFFSRPGCYRFLTLKKIKKLARRSTQRNFIIISTSIGLLTVFECLKKRIGGLLLCSVSI